MRVTKETIDFLHNYPTTGGESKERKTKKRAIPLEDDDDDVLPREYGLKKKTRLNLRLDENMFTVPELVDKVLPREDGYVDATLEAADAKNRPYGKEYISDMQERARLLRTNPNYRFMARVAGYLRKPVWEVFDEEDLDRVQREREEARLATEIDQKRTRVTMEEKYEAIKRQRELIADLRRQYAILFASRPPDFLLRRARTLIDPNLIGRQRDITPDRARDVTTPPRETSYTNLMHTRAEYELIAELGRGQRPKWEDMLTRIRDLERNVEDLNDAMNNVGSPNRQVICFIWYVVFRDFLDNDTELLIRESLAAKTKYLHQAVRLDLPTEVGTLVVPAYVDPGDTSDGIDWRLFRDTETLDMHALSLLYLSDELQMQLISAIPGSVYSKEVVQDFIAFITLPDAQSLADKEKLPAWRDVLELIGLFAFGGPSYAPVEKQPVPPGVAAVILRSHLLWTYFNETPIDRFVQTVFALEDQVEKGLFFKALCDMAPPVLAVLDRMTEIYEKLVNKYLTDLVYYFDPPPSDDDHPRHRVLARLPPTGATLAATNAIYRDTGVDDSITTLVADDAFRDYVLHGTKSFESRAKLAIELQVVDEAPPLHTHPAPSANPSFALHILFLLYTQYREQYTKFIQNEIALSERAIDKARNKIASLLGDERVDRHVDRDSAPAYVQRRAFTTQPINSGFVQIKPEIEAHISEAWHKTQQYCDGLRGMALPGYHCESAWACGLTDAFCAYIAALHAYNDLLLPERYNSEAHHRHVPQRLAGAMQRLKQFTYDWRGGDDYSVHIKGQNTHHTFSAAGYTPTSGTGAPAVHDMLKFGLF